MRRYLFEKANYFLNEQLVEQLDETDYSIRLKVGKEEVVIKYQNHQLIWICTCTQYVKGNKICSHAIAALAYLSNKK